MNISAIQTFLAVYRLGNLNRAAQELNITQSAVTARLDALETSLGAKLLNRSRKGASLTKAGFTFLDQASLIARTWDSARNRTAFPEGVTQLFSFVSDPMLWQGHGKALVAGWGKTAPDTAFEVWCASAAQAAEWLRSGLSDAALTDERIASDDVRSRVMVEETLMQVATRPREAIAWDDDYIFVDYGLSFRQWHADTWPGEETARFRFANPDWAMEHILSARQGSAYLPRTLVAPLVADERLFPVEGSPVFKRPLFLNWRVASEQAFEALLAS